MSSLSAADVNPALVRAEQAFREYIGNTGEPAERAGLLLRVEYGDVSDGDGGGHRSAWAAFDNEGSTSFNVRFIDMEGWRWPSAREFSDLYVRVQHELIMQQLQIELTRVLTIEPPETGGIITWPEVPDADSYNLYAGARDAYTWSGVDMGRLEDWRGLAAFDVAPRPSEHRALLDLIAEAVRGFATDDGALRNLDVNTQPPRLYLTFAVARRVIDLPDSVRFLSRREKAQLARDARGLIARLQIERRRERSYGASPAMAALPAIREHNQRLRAELIEREINPPLVMCEGEDVHFLEGISQRMAATLMYGVGLASPEQQAAAAAAAAKAYQLLEGWLTAEQRAEFKEHRYFHVTGGVTKRRYRITDATAQNVFELDHRGLPLIGHCFTVSGNLPAGDVMLSQKLALELQEDHALAKANMFVPSGASDRRSYNAINRREAEWLERRMEAIAQPIIAAAAGRVLDLLDGGITFRGIPVRVMDALTPDRRQDAWRYLMRAISIDASTT